MRNRILVLTAVLTLAGLTATAQTSQGFGNYHYETNINCVECHSMHASATDNLGGTGAITDPAVSDHYYPVPNPGTGNPQLLKRTAAQVCTACHDGTNVAPDVVEATNSSDGGYERSAGHIQTDTTGGGHLLGSTVRPPGWNTTAAGGWFNGTTTGGTLYCQSCHNPHGNLYFRNLGPDDMVTAVGAGNLPEYTKSATFADVFTDLTDVHVNLATKTMGDAASFDTYYGIDAVNYAKRAAAVSGGGDSIAANNKMDLFCSVCHGNFHGGAETVTATVGVGSGLGFKRHPTSTVTAAVNSAGGFADLRLYQAAATPAAGDSPGCLTCHRAHGNNNPFALIWPNHTVGDQNTTATAGSEEGGGGTVKTLCKACHTQGGTDNG